MSITYNEIPNNVAYLFSMNKASTFTPDATVPAIPISTGQSYIVGNADAVPMTVWHMGVDTFPVSGMDLSTGIWTVQESGRYNITCRFGLNAYTSAPLNGNLEEGNFGNGAFEVGFIGETGPTAGKVIFFMQIVTNSIGGPYLHTGFLPTIRTSRAIGNKQVLNLFLNAGEDYRLYVLNKTQLGYQQSNNFVSIHEGIGMQIEKLK